MSSINNKHNGLTKIYWSDIRERVLKVEPTFTLLVDKLSPDKSFPIYLAMYPYGAIESDTKSSLFPNQNGGYFRLSDIDAPKDICKNLGYSVNSAPLGMVLEKQLELYIDLKKDRITIPWLMYKPGMFFPFSSILKVKNHRVYAPNGILSCTAGARSAFMLPNIGCTVNHFNLKRDLSVKARTPKSLYEHWQVFKEITKYSEWKCCVIYFSEIWVNKLHTDNAWIEVKKYLHELAWKHSEYERNRVYYDIIFSMIQKKRNLRPNPYLADTARHLFATAIGASPAFVPTLNDETLPLNDIQTAYIESYNLKKYFPTVMTPKHFAYEGDTLPVYYSLQNPSTHIFSPNSRSFRYSLYELRELENIMRIFTEELSKKDSLCHDTIMGEIANNIVFQYYHNRPDSHRVANLTEDLLKLDKRFTVTYKKDLSTQMKFSSDSSFLRGCISISRK